MGFKDLYYLNENKTPLLDTIVSSGKVPSIQPTYIEINKEPYRSIIVNSCQLIPNNTWSFNLKSIESKNKYICTYIKDSTHISANLVIQHIPLYKHELSETELNYSEIKKQYDLNDNTLRLIHNSVTNKNFKTLIILSYNIYKDNLQDDFNILRNKTKLIIFNNIKQIELSKFTKYIEDFHSLLMSELDLQPNIDNKAKETD